MAVFFPEDLPRTVRADARLRAEIKLYDALKARIDRDWAIYYHIAVTVK